MDDQGKKFTSLARAHTYMAKVRDSLVGSQHGQDLRNYLIPRGPIGDT